MRFHFIDAHRDVHRVRGMCSVLEVSPSGFYAWKRREPCRTVQDDGKLVAEIDAVFQESRRMYGSPRVHAALRKRGRRLSRKRVARLMREKGIAPVAPNRMNRNFSSITVPDVV